MLLLLMRPFFLPLFPHTKVKNVKLVALMAVEVDVMDVAMVAMDAAITETEVDEAEAMEGDNKMVVDKVDDKAAETSEVR